MKADEGKVLVEGVDPFERLEEYRKKVAIILGQKGKLHPDMSILETSEVYGAMYKLSDSTIEERIFKIANMLKLSKDDLSKQARTLSLGQRMKGELCLSFINEPSVIFLDEPTLGLDARSTKNIRHFLREYCKERGATAVVTSHNLGDIIETSSKLLILNNGNQIFYGEINDLPALYNMDMKIEFIVDNENTRKRILEEFPMITESGNEFSIMCQSDEVDKTLNELYSCGNIFALRIEENPLESIIEELLHGE